MSEIFVFGSNLAGRHGRGSAYCAVKKHGAIYGLGEGRQGNSYAIPTKDESLNPLPLNEIAKHVDVFLSYARHNSQLTFTIVAIGCGYAGYKPEQIAWMFSNAPSNCTLPTAFTGVKHHADK